MDGSRQLVQTFLRGEVPPRIPLYDLLRNDAVIAHFAGRSATPQNGEVVVYKAYEPAVDATRPRIRTPQTEGMEVLPDGRRRQYFRWTDWISPLRFQASEDYAAEKKRFLSAYDPAWNGSKQNALEEKLARHAEEQRRLGDVFLFLAGPCEWLTSLYHEVGLEQFVYYQADYPELIDHLFEVNVAETVAWAEHLPRDLELDAVFLADDIAFNSGPLFSPQWFERAYIPRVSRIVAAFHRRGTKVLFHSDGNLYRLLDGLVEAGIDALNPIEIQAGMDVGDIHRRYPRLLLVGGIDVSHLLVFGSSDEIRDTVQRTIDAAEGRIMIGSTTEVHDAVPLESFLALRDAVLNFGKIRKALI
jgi:hypothetical protein